MPTWKLKLSEDGNAVLQDGRPVYVDESTNQEAALDVNQLHDKILQLNKENKQRRLDVEQTTGKLTSLQEKLGDVEDVDAFLADARKAMDVVKGLDAETLLKADKVDQIKAGMQAAFDEKEKKNRAKLESMLADHGNTLSRKEAQIRQLMVSNRFATCDLFSGAEPKTLLPPDIAEARFGSHFKVEEKDGVLQLVAYDHNNEVIQSRERPGEPASFDEAIQMLFDRHPDRDRLLRVPSGSGSGATGGSGTTRKQDELSVLSAQLAKVTDMRQRIAIKRRIAELMAQQKKK